MYIVPKRRKKTTVLDDSPQEADIIRLLLLYADKIMASTTRSVISYITESLDEIGWDNLSFNKIFAIYHEGWKQYQAVPDIHQLINHPDVDIKKAAVDVYAKHYEISHNWEKHDIFIVKIEDNVENDVVSAVTRINLKKIHKLLEESKARFKEPNALSAEEIDALLKEHMALEQHKVDLAQQLGTTITR